MLDFFRPLFNKQAQIAPRVILQNKILALLNSDHEWRKLHDAKCINKTSFELEALLHKYHQAVNNDHNKLHHKIGKKYLNKEEKDLFNNTTAHVALVQRVKYPLGYHELKRNEQTLNKEDYLKMMQMEFKHDNEVVALNLEMLKNDNLTGKDFIYAWDDGFDRDDQIILAYEKFNAEENCICESCLSNLKSRMIQDRKGWI